MVTSLTNSSSASYETICDNNNNVRIKPVHKFSVMLTNARSLSPKISSLHTFFAEQELDVALITESWLKDGETLDRDVIDLEWGTNLKIIYKNRPKRSVGRRRVGGGVSIVFNKDTCNLRERKISGNKFELVLAIGRVGRVTRQVAIFCAYIEPKMKVGELGELCKLISREILRLKSQGDPMIMVGGDLNRKSLEDAFQDFNDIARINNEPTRGDACLDIMYSNCTTFSFSTWPPLETPMGIKSDHLCVLFAGTQEIARNFHWTTKTARKHTQAAMDEYGRRLANADWERLLPPHLGPDELVSRFQEWTSRQTDELFPLKQVRL